MSLGESEGNDIEYQTLQGRNWPSVTQFSVFLENRVGQLQEVVRAFQGSKVKISALSISDSADCCIVRLILSHPEQGREILAIKKMAYAESELLIAELPNGPHALVDLCTALIQAEINIHYAYPLIVRTTAPPWRCTSTTSSKPARRSTKKGSRSSANPTSLLDLALLRPLRRFEPVQPLPQDRGMIEGKRSGRVVEVHRSPARLGGVVASGHLGRFSRKVGDVD